MSTPIMRLPLLSLSMETASTVPKKKRTPTAKEILDAFVADRGEPPNAQELDSIYTEAISDGLVTESEIRDAFRRFMDRRAAKPPRPEEAAELASTVGELVRTYREGRGLTVEQLALERGVDAAKLVTIEASDVLFEPARVVESARVLATHVGAPARVVNTLLQEAHARRSVRSSGGPMLRAARKAPPK